jgi:hypothetical protein
MTTWKLPPPAKVYEALTAVADGRVRLTTAGRAEVESSGRDKTYDVEWSEDQRSFTANDNASYWQGYVGYPIIAVLITIGELDVEPAVAKALAGVDWNAVNRRFRRDYDAAVSFVLSELETRGVDAEWIVRAADRLMEQLAALDLQRPSRGRPRRGA